VVVARYDSDAGPLAQGILQFPLAHVPEHQAPVWWALYQRLLQNVSTVRASSVAARVTIDENGSLKRTYIVLTRDVDDSVLRRYLASFTRLELLAEGSVCVPLTNAEYERALPAFPPFRIAATPPPYRVGEAWFACDFRVAPLLDDLISEARSRGNDFAYQLQAGLVNALPNATAICEEFVGVSDPKACDWLRSALLRAFNQRYRTARFEAPGFRIVENGFNDALTTAVHSALLYGPPTVDELVGGVVSDGEATALIGWRPQATTVAQLTKAVSWDEMDDAEQAGELGIRDVLPAPYEGPGRYLFVSYKRADAARIAPILGVVRALGYQIWYDDGIPGGSEWDAVIEERLKNADGVLMFLSREAVLSKYVRREVKFADMIAKPILTVRLENAQLSHGLQMLLTNYQMIDPPTSPARLEALRRALRSLELPQQTP
jgi:hypothetical protein